MARPPRTSLQRHASGVGRHLHDLLVSLPRRRTPRQKVLFFSAGLLVIGGSMFFTLGWSMRRPVWERPSAALLESLLPRSPDLTLPVREEPARFPASSYLPPRKEQHVCGGPGGRFLRQHDLVRVEDARVWWESDNDRHDTEDDHLMHCGMEEPFRRLVELVTRAGGTLKVQDTFREEGIHSALSLHKEGRAVDLTCDELGLERLAKLAWAAGFDWVYHETPRNGGAHVHASVREHRPRLPGNDSI